MASQVSPAFAPIIGGYITEYLLWKFNFIVLAIMMLLGAIFVKMTLPVLSYSRPNLGYRHHRTDICL
ncbi:hypothetical protein [Photorhabdus antumapuensis]|uniref:hypothetical protein n=1 Tax=Photorhabdus antumapuensis TaxID=2862867 RepID=UPI002102FE62|nr:hypothetical protein [Photorhabdus antumapuensis]